ncbi:RING-type domain-containing protein [Caerostris darwini]|uniref:RING-type domain-containing protein n=1 Tax=Caerostris darwini TaxID=1538125 RepID=A0AAV4RCC9_9ARAC|nr:RING-type domain-containing protein [Caerostris darwini]
MNGILKTLECSICLELLKNPVSTGCGHFFCRFCISEVLHSNYRTRCPLRKKSFTRRGIQEAHQRKFVILAVKKLAEACGNMQIYNFFPKTIHK